MKIDLSNIDTGISTDVQKLLRRAFRDGIDCNVPITYGHAIKLETAVEGVYVEVKVDADDRIVLPAVKISVTKDSDPGNALYISHISSATSGNQYGVRLFISGTGVSTGMIRGIRCEADMGEAAEATLLEAGLFTAKVSSGDAVVDNIRILSAHLSIGKDLVVSGDVVAVNAHIQTRGNEDISGVHCGVYVKNEAVGGTGKTLDSAIYVTEAYLGGGEKGYGVLIDASTAELDVHDTDRVTLIKFKDSGGTVRKLVFDPTNDTVVAVQT